MSFITRSLSAAAIPSSLVAARSVLVGPEGRREVLRILTRNARKAGFALTPWLPVTTRHRPRQRSCRRLITGCRGLRPGGGLQRA